MTTFCISQNGENGRHVTQVNMKIDTEVAGLKTMLESHKLDTIKYLAGKSFLSCGIPGPTLIDKCSHSRDLDRFVGQLL